MSVAIASPSEIRATARLALAAAQHLPVTIDADRVLWSLRCVEIAQHAASVQTYDITPADEQAMRDTGMFDDRYIGASALIGMENEPDTIDATIAHPDNLRRLCRLLQGIRHNTVTNAGTEWLPAPAAEVLDAIHVTALRRLAAV